MKNNALTILGAVLLLLILGYIYHINRITREGVWGRSSRASRSTVAGATSDTVPGEWGGYRGGDGPPIQRLPAGENYNSDGTAGPFRPGDKLSPAPVNSSSRDRIYDPNGSIESEPPNIQYGRLNPSQARALNEAYENDQLDPAYTSRGTGQGGGESNRWTSESDPSNYPVNNDAGFGYNPPYVQHEGGIPPPYSDGGTLPPYSE